MASFDDVTPPKRDWDEGPECGGPYGPYMQSEKTDSYAPHAQRLLETGHAYRCFCSGERIQEASKAREKQGLRPGYDRHCRDLDPAEARRLLREFPEGWARRRALSALLRRRVPDSLEEALTLIGELEPPSARRWCLGTILQHWENLNFTGGARTGGIYDLDSGRVRILGD